MANCNASFANHRWSRILMSNNNSHERRMWLFIHVLTHWGRVTHICVRKLTIIGLDNGLAPGRRQAIIWTNDEILLIGHLRTNLSEILSKVHTFPFKKMHLKTSSAKWRPFCLGLNVLISIFFCFGKSGHRRCFFYFRLIVFFLWHVQCTLWFIAKALLCHAIHVCIRQSWNRMTRYTSDSRHCVKFLYWIVRMQNLYSPAILLIFRIFA